MGPFGTEVPNGFFFSVMQGYDGLLRSQDKRISSNPYRNGWRLSGEGRYSLPRRFGAKTGARSAVKLDAGA